MTRTSIRTRAAVACLGLLLAPAPPSRAAVSSVPNVRGVASPARTPDGPKASGVDTPGVQAPGVDTLDVLPMAFEPNVGQTDARVRYVARGRGYTAFLTADGPVIALRPTPTRQESVALRLGGVRPPSRVTPERELPGKSNYLTGADPADWRRDVPTYAAVRYEGLYPGVDAVFHGASRRLEYDFVVAPGADPSEIRVRFEGQLGARVDENGDLVLELAAGELRQRRASVYQQGAAGKRDVGARYVLRGGDEVGFEVSDYDRTLPLVIDPVVAYSAYLGGGISDEEARGIAVDGTGATYVVGTTDATNFPTTPGAFDATGHPPILFPVADGDAFVTKLSSDGSSLVYSTYLGGGRDDDARGIAVDGAGNAFVTGWTESPNFPTTPGAFDATANGNPDTFVAKLDANGSALVYSTMLGAEGWDRAYAIALGSGGVAFVTGQTSSPAFPTTPGAFDRTFNNAEAEDAFVTGINAAGTGLVYSTFLGGNGSDYANDVAVDAAGAIYVVGSTSSTPGFPVTPGAFATAPTPGGTGREGFVTKLAPGGASLAYSTFLGGQGDDDLKGVAVDATGAAYVCGGTEFGASYPSTPGAIGPGGSFAYDAVVTKLNAAGSALVYSARFGNMNQEAANGIAVDASGAAYVTGETNSPGFPTTSGAFDTTVDATDAFVAKVNATGTAFVYSTLLGGASIDSGASIAVDPAGAAYVAGRTESSDYPTTPGAFNRSHRGLGDAFVTKVSATASSLVYSTYLAGGASFENPVEDVANGVAVDASGAIYLAGYTRSVNFPTTIGAYDPTFNSPSPDVAEDDAFVSKIDASGTALVYSTYLGGGDAERAAAISVDATGAVYVVGATSSEDFPTTPGALDPTLGSEFGSDAFVTKLDAAGSALVYSTYLGGFSGDGAYALAVDASGVAYVAGITSSDDFPVTAGAFDSTYNGSFRFDAFVTKIDAAGTALVYSTYLGAGADDLANGIAVDATGAAYVTGETYSPTFPTTPGAFDTTFNSVGVGNATSDAFLVKLAPSGASLVYATLLGGGQYDIGASVVVDPTGAAYVGGSTRSMDYPTTPGAFDTVQDQFFEFAGFVTKVNAAGTALVYSTYLNGDFDDNVFALRLDPAGRAYVTGRTMSSDFPNTPDAYDHLLNGGFSSVNDAFLAVLDASGSALVYCTYLGGSDSDIGTAVAVDGAGLVYVAGYASSSDFAQSGFGSPDGFNAFVAKLRLPAAGVEAADTPGVYVASSGARFLRNSNTPGGADVTFTFGGGGAGLVPIAGDWDGDGDDTAGLYARATGAFFLKNANSGGAADVVFTFGGGGALVPLAGDWNGDGIDTVGLYDPATGAVFLRNSNAPGAADVVFTFGGGGAGITPIVGDWNGDGADTIGLYVASTGTFFLRNANGPGAADLAFSYGPANATPIRGDWNGDGIDTVGVYVGAGGSWFLRDANTPGAATTTFAYGPATALPLAGDWDGL